MITVSTWRDEEKRATVYHIVIPDVVLDRVELDRLDKQTIQSPITMTADVFQNLEIITRRYEEQLRREKLREIGDLN